MATIDPNIALGVKPLQVENPMNQYAAMSQIQSNQQANQLNALKMQEYERGLGEENKLRALLSSGADLNSPETIRKMYEISPTKGLEFQTKQQTIKKTGLEATKLESEIVDQRLKQSRQFLDTIDPSDPNAPALYMQWHKANHADPILGPMLAKRGVTEEQSLATIQNAIAQGPQAFSSLLNQSKMGVEKFAEANKPQVIQTNNGGTNTVSTVTPYGGAPNVISTTNKTATPGELMVDARAREKLAQDTKTLDPQENAALSKAILDGRLDPNKINSRNSKILAATLIANPNANLVNLGAVAAGATVEGRTLGTINAKVASAATEAGSMIDLVNDYSKIVDRTKYPTLNAIQNAIDKGTGGEDIVKLNTAMNSLINSYARAINPSGVATVNDKNHAREILNSAFSNGQVQATTAVMRQEIDLALASPMKAQEQLTKSRGGTGTGGNANKPAPSTTNLPAGVGADWVLKTDSKGNKAYVSPDNSKFVEVK